MTKKYSNVLSFCWKLNVSWVFAFSADSAHCLPTIPSQSPANPQAAIIADHIDFLLLSPLPSDFKHFFSPRPLGVGCFLLRPHSLPRLPRGLLSLTPDALGSSAEIAAQIKGFRECIADLI